MKGIYAKLSVGPVTVQMTNTAAQSAVLTTAAENAHSRQTTQSHSNSLDLSSISYLDKIKHKCRLFGKNTGCNRLLRKFVYL